MVKDLVHDPLFLAQKSEPATPADAQVITNLLDTNEEKYFVRISNPGKCN